MTQRDRTVIGTVVALWRYPVKSMRGEPLDAAALGERGVLGDRAYAILDLATGLIASAKHPRKWPTLLACRAEFVAPPEPNAPLPPVLITLPDGSTIHSAQPGANQQLSRALGRDVALIADAPPTPTREADRTPIDEPAHEPVIKREPLGGAAPPGTFFDYAPLHVLTSATLARLQQLHPGGQFDARRFRPNLLIAPASQAPAFAENDWLGHTLVVGAGLRLPTIDPCPRCVITTLAQDDLARDPGILRAIQANLAASVTAAPGALFSAVAGIYARALGDGTVRCGDLVRLAE